MCGVLAGLPPGESALMVAVPLLGCEAVHGVSGGPGSDDGPDGPARARRIEEVALDLEQTVVGVVLAGRGRSERHGAGDAGDEAVPPGTANEHRPATESFARGQRMAMRADPGVTGDEEHHRV